MSYVLLEFPLDAERPKDLDTFAFVRGPDNRGDWVTAPDRNGEGANIIVPTSVAAALTVRARIVGLLERHNFARSAPRLAATVVPTVREKTAGKSGRKPGKTSGLMGGFNPFAGGK